MNGFDRFGIEQLAPTVLAQWDAAPATLILKRVFGVKTEANANMWRGDAVEAGGLFFLHNRAKQDVKANAIKHGVDTFWQRAGGEIADETEAAAELVPGMIEQVMEALADAPPMMANQLRVDMHLGDLATPVVGKMDYVFEDGSIVELKTTTRCPSKLENVTISHRWQAACYAQARQKPVKLLYATAKKHDSFLVEPGDASLVSLQQTAEAMNTALLAVDDGAHLLRSLPLNVSSFYWDEPVVEAYTKALKGELKPLKGPGTKDLAAQGYITFGKHMGKHISEVPDKYRNWLMDPQLSDGGTYDVPEALQTAIRELEAA